MLRHILTSALLAGIAAGLLAALLQYVLVERFILLAEEYETGAMVHFGGVAAEEAGHDHGQAVADAAGTDVAAEPAHTHGAADEGEVSLATRHALSVLFMTVVYCGYGLMLVAGFALAEHYGRKVTVLDGLLWGLGGFLAFQLMPAMGLSPELPGTPAADLTARQIWWVSTAICTGVALALIAYGRNAVSWVVAIVIAALPHVIGAPELENFAGVVPPEVSAAFAARTLGVGLIAWAALGWVAGRLWNSPQQIGAVA